MKKYITTCFFIIFLNLSGLSTAAEPVEIISIGQELSTAHLEPDHLKSKPGIAVIFEGTEGLHYYAKPETAPAAGFELKVEADSDNFRFGETVFPKWTVFEDLTGKKVWG